MIVIKLKQLIGPEITCDSSLESLQWTRVI